MHSTYCTVALPGDVFPLFFSFVILHSLFFSSLPIFFPDLNMFCNNHTENVSLNLTSLVSTFPLDSRPTLASAAASEGRLRSCLLCSGSTALRQVGTVAAVTGRA